MNHTEIIIIDDDEDDRDLFKDALHELNVENPICFFADAIAALQHLKSITHNPFLIICDINMPGINGLEFKESINDYNDSKIIAIPFVFVSTSASPTMLRFARNLNIQGYFQKPASPGELKEVLNRIVQYWQSAYQVFD